MVSTISWGHSIFGNILNRLYKESLALKKRDNIFVTQGRLAILKRILNCVEIKILERLLERLLNVISF